MGGSVGFVVRIQRPPRSTHVPYNTLLRSTDEQIKEKMKKFKIDDSRVKTNGDVRIRYTGSKNGKSKADARVQTEMTFTL